MLFTCKDLKPFQIYTEMERRFHHEQPKAGDEPEFEQALKNMGDN